MSDEGLPRPTSEEDSAALGEATPAPDAREHAEITALAQLVTVKDDFELSGAARARGLLGLERALVQHTRKKRATVALVWSLPVAAAVLFAWLLPLSPAPEGPPPATPALLEAQNAHLTARLTGAPIARDEYDRAQKAYRQELLLALEKRR